MISTDALDHALEESAHRKKKSALPTSCSRSGLRDNAYLTLVTFSFETFGARPPHNYRWQ